MKQTARTLSTYTGDTSGVCSALFELGGMTVMHDASGCNSTYNTHDEPRWYDFDSLVFISGLSEMEAVMGDDSKLIADIVSAAVELSPRFIAIAGTPIPMMTGVDFDAVAACVERKTGIPSFGFSTNGMHSYVSGASMAFERVAERLCDRSVTRGDTLSANILGVTPLDFSVNGSDTALRQVLETAGIAVNAVWAMGSDFESVKNSGRAQVNLVVSATGLAAAKSLRRLFGTPYVVGTPIGTDFSQKITDALKIAAKTGENKVVCRSQPDGADTVIIGESVMSLSLAAALNAQTDIRASVLCPVESDPLLLGDGCIAATDEDELIPILKNAKRVIADPLYHPICPQNAKFISLPHEAFSGRIYRKEIPNLQSDFNIFIKEVIS